MARQVVTVLALYGLARPVAIWAASRARVAPVAAMFLPVALSA
jgi:hypothetical protein